MAKVKDNPITAGASGKLGRRLVFRHMKDGRTIIATRPDYTDHKWTTGQKAHHTRFQEAAAYARVASKTNPLYAELAAGTSKNAYNLALSDWFKPPVIHSVTRQDGSILVSASDNVQVTSVLITICDQEGEIIEQGQAKLTYKELWEYATTTQGKIRVEAKDLAGNVASRESQ